MAEGEDGEGVTKGKRPRAAAERGETERKRKRPRKPPPVTNYMLLYVRRKVRIRTILGFSCANLGS